MSAVWFWTLAAMLTVYAVLDGYDLGVGALHLWLCRGNDQRRIALNAIGPVWNGNEVWLIASGGVMVAVFPRLYASAFSGFYLALIVVLWLLLLRGIAIEFRGQIGNPLWRDFWDAVFGLASALLALLLGVALGNVVRGLPLARNGYFLGSFTLMLNPYALLTGLLSLVVLAWHGANFLRTHSQGELQERCRRWARAGWWAALILTGLATAATASVRADMLANFFHHPALALLPLTAVLGFALSFRSSPRWSWRGSSLVVIGLLLAAAATNYPVLLPSTLAPQFSLTIANAAASPTALVAAFIGNSIALALVAAYSFYIHRVFAGPVEPGEHGY